MIKKLQFAAIESKFQENSACTKMLLSCSALQPSDRSQGICLQAVDSFHAATLKRLSIEPKLIVA
jgi:hypothetical protein